DVLDGDPPINAVLVEQVDRLDLESTERSFGYLTDVLGPRVEAVARAVRVDAEAELGGDDHPVAHGAQRFADERLVRERAVRSGGVKERHAPLDGRANDRHAFLPTGTRSVDTCEAHTAVAD